MSRKNYINQILDYLKSTDHATARQLAAVCNVSERSIHNYIAEINAQKEIILSSSNGYSLKKGAEIPVNKGPVTQDERIFYIILKLLKQGNSVNVVSLTEELYISEATLSKDLQSIKKELDEYNLKLKRKAGYLYLVGDEKDKRNFIREIIVSNGNGVTFESMHYELDNGATPNLTSDIRDTVLEGLKSAGLFINDYSLNNIVLHLSITVNRLLHNNTLISSSFNNVKAFPDELKAAEYICNKLATTYGITFPENEVEQVSFLLISKTSNIDFYNLSNDDIALIVGTSYYQMAETIIKEVYENFYLDIADEEFLLKFSLHLKNATFRASNSYSEKNQIFDNIKYSYPLVYDVAVFCAMEFRKMTGLTLSEDEISFLAIHIGSVIEQKNKLSKKVKAILIYPRYYDYNRTVLVKINNHFSEDLEIVSTLSMMESIPDIEYDLIISSVKYEHPGKEVVVINPFLTENDYEKIRTKIKKIKALQQHSISSNAALLFSKELFEKEHYFKDEYEAIEYMCDKVIQMGLAPAEFKQGVIEREKSASTAFDNLTAIPHTIEVAANRTFGYVIINKKPIKWGNFDINIIILIGIARDSNVDFTEFYPSLLDILDDKEKTEQMIQSVDFKHFIYNFK